MRKYRGNYKIPIHKHTPKRRPMSKYTVKILNGGYDSILNNTVVPLVQDIKPVREVSVAGYAEKLISLFNERLEENKKTIILEQDEIIPPKPKSLLERLTNKIRRKDNGK